MAGKGGGGAWKVAYADFVTAMMAFFLVMWITAQSKPIKESVAGYFNDPYGGPATRPNGSSYKRTMENGDAPFTRGKPMIGPGRGRGMSTPSKRKIKNDEDATSTATTSRKPPMFFHGGDRSYIGTALLFAEDSSELDEAGVQRLEELIPWIAGKPNKIEIRGHSSGRPPGADSTHGDIWELCFARCAAAMAFLRKHGIEPERIRLSQGGAFDRQGLSGDRERSAEQSRVEVFLLNEYVGDLAPTDDGQIDPELQSGKAKRTVGSTPKAGGTTHAERTRYSEAVVAEESTATGDSDVTEHSPIGHASSRHTADTDSVEEAETPSGGKKYQHLDAPAH